MTVPAEAMQAPVMPTDPVRLSRALSQKAAAMPDSPQSIAIAGELRSLGRPDLALKIVESDQPDSLAQQFELARDLALAGYGARSMAIMRRIVEDAGADMGHVAFAIDQAARRDPPQVATLDFQMIFDLARRTGRVDAVLQSLPFTLTPGSALTALWRGHLLTEPAAILAFTARVLGARGAITMLRLAFAVLFAGLSLITGKRRILLASMGKFTRLADLVDRIDPMLRRLRAEGDNFKLFVFFFGGYPNRQLFEMYQRHCTLVPATNRVTRKLANIVIALLRRAGRFTELTVDYRRINQDFLNNPPVLAFQAGEEKRIRAEMVQAGIDPDRPIICFGLRDMAYYQFYGDVMRIPLSQQGKRSETHHRCPPLSTYVDCARFWAGRDYQVVRMGLRVSEPMPEGLGPNVIDYANGARSDELDAYLFARCRFQLAGDTGLFSGAAAFDRPAVLSDLFLIRNTMYSSNKTTRNIFVPKLIRDDRDGRLLTFRELINFNHFFSFNDACETNGFSIVHNSAEDLIDATDELEQRLAGTYQGSVEDDRLQAAYHAIYTPAQIGYHSTGLVSAKFLRKYAHLLD